MKATQKNYTRSTTTMDATIESKTKDYDEIHELIIKLSEDLSKDYEIELSFYEIKDLLSPHGHDFLFDLPYVQLKSTISLLWENRLRERRRCCFFKFLDLRSQNSILGLDSMTLKNSDGFRLDEENLFKYWNEVSNSGGFWWYESEIREKIKQDLEAEHYED